jgi:RimJ/RimL family protein N-acetyltransferase
MSVSYKANEMYRELELYDGDTKIGEAEVDLSGRMLSRLNIYEPYQNKGYGQQVVHDLMIAYNITSLWVNADNERAIHVYEKCGFRKIRPTMYLMEIQT